jgi:chromosomal replication initiator protein
MMFASNVPDDPKMPGSSEARGVSDTGGVSAASAMAAGLGCAGTVAGSAMKFDFAGLDPAEPDTRTPDAHTPDAHTPAAHTPVAQAPVVRAPVAQAPEASAAATSPAAADPSVGPGARLAAARQIWQAAQPRLRGLFTQLELETWISHIKVIDACDRMVVLRGGNSFAASRIRTQFLSRLQDRWALVDPLGRTLVVDLKRPRLAAAAQSGSLSAALGGSEPISDRSPVSGLPAVASDSHRCAPLADFHPHSAFGGPNRRGGDGDASSVGVPNRLPGSLPGDLGDLEAPLQSGAAGFRLDTFETGPSNELAHALARRVCQDPKGRAMQSGDVTYIHGQHGTGKTHLAEAIRHGLSQGHPELRVLLVPGQNFLGVFQAMLREGKGAQFSAAVCSADVLVVDDINLVCGKRATEDELEQCIRRLNRMGRKVVLTGDVPCEALQVMSSGLMSLLKASYHAGLDLPDLDLRRQIAAREAADLGQTSPGFTLDGRCLDMIAARVTGSGRLVKGAVRQVYLRSFLLGKEADMNAVLNTISEKSAIAPRSLSVERIKRAVCAHFDLTLDDLISPTRRRSVARPRQIAMYLCRKHTERSLPDIGRRFGNRDHATVIHAVRTIEDMILRDAQIAGDVDAVLAKLASGQIGG